MPSHSVYRIVCTVNGKVYVGQSIHPKTRRKEHFSQLRCGIHPNPHLLNAFNRYGESCFYFEVIEKDIPPERINEREMYWIAHFDSYHNGFNRSVGGDKPPGFPPTQTTWNGIAYPSLREASEANGVQRYTLSYWIKRGYSCDNDVPKTYRSGLSRLRIGNGVHPCVWNGIEYPSIKAAAQANNIDYRLMQQRIANGYTSDGDMKGSEKSCTWNGILYPSITKAAQAIGIRLDTLQRRLERGQTRDADMKGTGSNKSKECVWNGVTYPTIRAAAKAIGIAENTMSLRLKNGYTCDNDMIGNRARKQSDL